MSKELYYLNKRTKGDVMEMFYLIQFAEQGWTLTSTQHWNLIQNIDCAGQFFISQTPVFKTILYYILITKISVSINDKFKGTVSEISSVFHANMADSQPYP